MRRPHPRFDTTHNAWVTKAGGKLTIPAKGPKNAETEAAAWDAFYVHMAKLGNPVPDAAVPSITLGQLADRYGDWMRREVEAGRLLALRRPAGGSRNRGECTVPTPIPPDLPRELLQAHAGLLMTLEALRRSRETPHDHACDAGGACSLCHLRRSLTVATARAARAYDCVEAASAPLVDRDTLDVGIVGHVRCGGWV